MSFSREATGPSRVAPSPGSESAASRLSARKQGIGALIERLHLIQRMPGLSPLNVNLNDFLSPPAASVYFPFTFGCPRNPKVCQNGTVKATGGVGRDYGGTTVGLRWDYGGTTVGRRRGNGGPAGPPGASPSVPFWHTIPPSLQMSISNRYLNSIPGPIHEAVGDDVKSL